jgi:Tfp pilus assembly PilM family ATPase
MQWPFTKNNSRYGLAGDLSRALLTAKNQSPTGTTTATPLGWADCPLSEAKSVHQVMINLTNSSGDVAISLPLDQFEVLPLAVNKVPKEVIAKILPYHIAKVLDEPLSDFIYDWQVVKELKDSLQLNVFLFPAKMFQKLRTTLGHYNLSLTTLEPDVFSACAYLEARNNFQADQATMIALLWPQSISIAIYDKETVVLTRNVKLGKPHLDQVNKDQHESPEIEMMDEDVRSESVAETSEQESIFEPNHDTLLENFLIQTRKEEDGKPAPEFSNPTAAEQDISNGPPVIPQTAEQGLPAYSNQVSLELMRTRDYFNSVVKGNQVKTVFVGGGEDIWQTLSPDLQNSLGINVKHLLEPELATIGDALFEAISIGVLS